MRPECASTTTRKNDIVQPMRADGCGDMSRRFHEQSKRPLVRYGSSSKRNFVRIVAAKNAFNDRFRAPVDVKLFRGNRFRSGEPARFEPTRKPLRRDVSSAEATFKLESGGSVPRFFVDNQTRRNVNSATKAARTPRLHAVVKNGFRTEMVERRSFGRRIR